MAMKSFVEQEMLKKEKMIKEYTSNKNIKTVSIFIQQIYDIKNINIFLQQLLDIQIDDDFTNLYQMYKNNKDINIDEIIINKYKSILPTISSITVNNLVYDYTMLFTQLIKLFISNEIPLVYYLGKEIKCSIFNNELRKIQIFLNLLLNDNLSSNEQVEFIQLVNPTEFYLYSLHWIEALNDNSIKNSNFLDEQTICENIPFYNDLYNRPNKKFLILLNFFYYRVNFLLLSNETQGIENNIKLYKYIYQVSEPLIILYSLIKSNNDDKTFFDYLEKFKLLEWNDDFDNEKYNYFKCGDEVRFKQKKSFSRFNVKGKILSFSGKDDFSYYVANKNNKIFKYSLIKNSDIKGNIGTRVIVFDTKQKIRNSTIDIILRDEGSVFGIDKKTYNNAIEKIKKVYKIGRITEVHQNGEYLVKFDDDDFILCKDEEMVKFFKPKQDAFLSYYDYPGEEVEFENNLVHNSVQKGKICEIFVSNNQSGMLGGASQSFVKKCNENVCKICQGENCKCGNLGKTKYKGKIAYNYDDNKICYRNNLYNTLSEVYNQIDNENNTYKFRIQVDGENQTVVKSVKEVFKQPTIFEYRQKLILLLGIIEDFVELYYKFTPIKSTMDPDLPIVRQFTSLLPRNRESCRQYSFKNRIKNISSHGINTMDRVANYNSTSLLSRLNNHNVHGGVERKIKEHGEENDNLAVQCASSKICNYNLIDGECYKSQDIDSFNYNQIEKVDDYCKRYDDNENECEKQKTETSFPTRLDSVKGYTDNTIQLCNFDKKTNQCKRSCNSGNCKMCKNQYYHKKIPKCKAKDKNFRKNMSKSNDPEWVNIGDYCTYKPARIWGEDGCSNRYEFLNSDEIFFKSGSEIQKRQLITLNSDNEYSLIESLSIAVFSDEFKEISDKTISEINIQKIKETVEEKIKEEGDSTKKSDMIYILEQKSLDHIDIIRLFEYCYNRQIHRIEKNYRSKSFTIKYDNNHASNSVIKPIYLLFSEYSKKYKYQPLMNNEELYQYSKDSDFVDRIQNYISDKEWKKKKKAAEKANAGVERGYKQKIPGRTVILDGQQLEIGRSPADGDCGYWSFIYSMQNINKEVPQHPTVLRRQLLEYIQNNRDAVGSCLAQDDGGRGDELTPQLALDNFSLEDENGISNFGSIQLGIDSPGHINSWITAPILKILSCGFEIVIKVKVAVGNFTVTYNNTRFDDTIYLYLSGNHSVPLLRVNNELIEKGSKKKNIESAKILIQGLHANSKNEEIIEIKQKLERKKRMKESALPGDIGKLIKDDLKEKELKIMQNAFIPLFLQDEHDPETLDNFGDNKDIDAYFILRDLHKQADIIKETDWEIVTPPGSGFFILKNSNDEYSYTLPKEDFEKVLSQKKNIIEYVDDQDEEKKEEINNIISDIEFYIKIIEIEIENKGGKMTTGEKFILGATAVQSVISVISIILPVLVKYNMVDPEFNQEFQNSLSNAQRITSNYQGQQEQNLLKDVLAGDVDINFSILEGLPFVGQYYKMSGSRFMALRNIHLDLKENLKGVEEIKDTIKQDYKDAYERKNIKQAMEPGTFNEKLDILSNDPSNTRIAGKVMREGSRMFHPDKNKGKDTKFIAFENFLNFVPGPGKRQVNVKSANIDQKIESLWKVREKGYREKGVEGTNLDKLKTDFVKYFRNVKIGDMLGDNKFTIDRALQIREIVDYKLGVHTQQMKNLGYNKMNEFDQVIKLPEISREIVKSLDTLLPKSGGDVVTSLLSGNFYKSGAAENLPKKVEVFDSDNQHHVLSLSEENAKSLDFISLHDNSIKYNNGSFQFQEPRNLRILQSVIIKDISEKSLINSIGNNLGNYLKRRFLYVYSKMVKINSFLKGIDPLKILPSAEASKIPDIGIYINNGIIIEDVESDNIDTNSLSYLDKMKLVTDSNDKRISSRFRDIGESGREKRLDPQQEEHKGKIGLWIKEEDTGGKKSKKNKKIKRKSIKRKTNKIGGKYIQRNRNILDIRKLKNKQKKKSLKVYKFYNKKSKKNRCKRKVNNISQKVKKVLTRKTMRRRDFKST